MSAKAICHCCGETTATCVDPHLGPVCYGCKLALIDAGDFVKSVSYIVGLGRCQEKPAQ